MYHSNVCPFPLLKRTITLLFGRGARVEPTPSPVLNHHLGVVWAHQDGPTIGQMTHIALAI
jgi:hypothetical protein